MTEFDKVIPPGGVGKVNASIDTTHYKGPIAKTVTVTTNDPTRSAVVLQLKGEVVTPVDVQPNENVVVRGKVGVLKPVEVTVSSTQGRRFDILAIKADPSVTVGVKPNPLDRGQKLAKGKRGPAGALASGASRYVVTIAPRADIPVGRSVSTVTLTTNHPEGETVRVYVTLDVAGEIHVSPATLVLTPPGTANEHVKISKREDPALKILRVESNDSDFVVTTNTVTEGREYDLVVRYAGKPGRGAVSARITVKTNDARQSAIVIPVVGYILPSP